MTSKNIDDAGINLIKEFEGYKNQAYKCSAGYWTIGYGHKLTTKDDFARIAQGINRKDATDKDITGANRELTLKECEDILKQDLRVFCDGVRMAINNKATQNQFNAMVSLAYNIGLGAFKGSSVLKYHKIGNYKDASEWFLAWKNATINGVKKPILLPRREKEKALYEKG